MTSRLTSTTMSIVLVVLDVLETLVLRQHSSTEAIVVLSVSSSIFSRRLTRRCHNSSRQSHVRDPALAAAAAAVDGPVAVAVVASQRSRTSDLSGAALVLLTLAKEAVTVDSAVAKAMAAVAASTAVAVVPAMATRVATATGGSASQWRLLPTQHRADPEGTRPLAHFTFQWHQHYSRTFALDTKTIITMWLSGTHFTLYSFML